MNKKDRGFKKLETEYLGASDIVSLVGDQYVIKEPEMESALEEVFKEIDYSKNNESKENKKIHNRSHY